MFSVEEVNKVKKVICHVKSPDGIAAAMVLHSALPQAEILFLGHREQAFKEMPAEEGLLFCGVTPPQNRVREFVDAKCLVLARHKKTGSLVKEFGARGVFANDEEHPGISAAVLAYLGVWLPLFKEGTIPLPVPLPKLSASILWQECVREFVVLSGVRDTWLRSHARWEEACKQAKALTFFPPEHFLTDPPRIPTLTVAEQKIGELLLEQKNRNVVAAKERAFTLHLKGKRFAIVQGAGLISDLVDELPKHDAVFGFSYNAQPTQPHKLYMTINCRADGKFDVGAFAAAFGGGGFPNSAMLEQGVFPDSPNPYTVIKELLQKYL